MKKTILISMVICLILVSKAINAVTISGTATISGNARIGIFSPEIFEPLAWFDAQDDDTISLNGDFVTQWYDKSGNNFNAAQGTPSLQPRLSDFAGKQTINFNVDVMEYGPTPALNAYTIVIVCKYNFVSGGSATMHPIGLGLAVAPVVFYKPSGSAFLRHVQAGVQANFLDTVIDTGFTLQICTYFNPIVQGWINGVRDTAKSSVSTTVSSAISRIGSYLASGASGISGEIGEVLIFDKALTSKQINILTDYLNVKWGLGL